MGFSLILRAFFSFPNERQFIECQFFWEFRFSAGSILRGHLLERVSLWKKQKTEGRLAASPAIDRKNFRCQNL